MSNDVKQMTGESEIETSKGFDPRTCDVGVIDYGAGNLRSVVNAFGALGVEPRLVHSAEDCKGLTHLVLPGVGSFGDCVTKLRHQGLEPLIRAWIAEDKPFLGICVGYQVLFESGEETPDVPGLGIFRGRVVKFPEMGLKIPHMGWNSLDLVNSEDSLWQHMSDDPYVYFVHSYYPEVEDESLISSSCTYGVEFAASITRGRLVATQFHPEKSQRTGLLLLQNFLKRA